MATAKSSKSSVVKITGEGRYPSVPLNQIEIVERPAEGCESEQLFYNPRSLDSFSHAEMQELLISIRTDGLQQPPQVRAITQEDGKPIAIELIAGERRIRTLSTIVENDYPCFDEDAKPPQKYRSGETVLHKGRFAKVLSHKASGVSIQLFDSYGIELTDENREVPAEEIHPTVSGSKLYQNVPCRVMFDCNDERALRLAFTENDKSKSLKTKEEIALVERLLGMDLKQGEIAEMLGTNETWVSQTLNFRSSLPKAAYQKLLDGTMTRHVAVAVMGFKEEDRERLFEETMKAADADVEKRIEEAQDDVERAEDDEELALADKKKAEKNHDPSAAKKAEREAKNAVTRAKKAESKKSRAEDERGVVKQSHVAAAAAKADLNPKKAKMLPKDQIVSLIIEKLEEFEDGETVDPEFGEIVPQDLVMAIQRTARYILNGGRDPLEIIRSIQVELGRWDSEISAETEDEAEDDDEAEAEDDDESEVASKLDSEFGEAFDEDDYDEDDYDDYDPSLEELACGDEED